MGNLGNLGLSLFILVILHDRCMPMDQVSMQFRLSLRVISCILTPDMGLSSYLHRHPVQRYDDWLYPLFSCAMASPRSFRPFEFLRLILILFNRQLELFNINFFQFTLATLHLNHCTT